MTSFTLHVGSKDTTSLVGVAAEIIVGERKEHVEFERCIART